MKNLLAIAVLLLVLPSCVGLTSDNLSALEGQARSERLVAERAVAISGRTLTSAERASVVSVALSSTRDPLTSRIRLRGFSYEMRGVRRADFHLSGLNGLGGPTGWVLYHAEFLSGGRVHVVRGGLSEGYERLILDAMAAGR